MRSRYFNTAARILSSLVLLSSVAGCNYRELSELYYSSAKIWIAVDWSNFTKEVPTGMSVYCYPLDSKDRTEPYVYLSNDISGVTANLPLGRYDIMVFNQSVNEFGSMTFEGMDQIGTAKAVLEDYDAKWSVKTDGQSVCYEPEWLAIDTYRDLEVTMDMVKDGAIVTLYPENVVYTAHAKIRLYGANNVRSVRGSMTGMSKAIMMATGEHVSTTVTHALETWSLSHDTADRTKGEISTTFTTFGLPSGSKAIDKTRKPEANHLYATFLLVDDKTKADVSYKVGNRLDVDDRNLEITLTVGYSSSDGQDPGENIDPDKPIVIPDVGPSGEGGGFTAVLNDWDADQEIEVPINGK